MTMTDEKESVIIVGGGLAGLVAAYEITKAGKKVIIVDQENEGNLGGQAFWSLGGLFLVDSRQQRWMGIKDSKALAMRDWMNSAAFDRPDDEDYWAKQWAEAFVNFACDEFRAYLDEVGASVMPNVGWAERGSMDAEGHGNSVPRFHITWGTGPEVVRVFRDPVVEAAKRGLVDFRFRHRVDSILVDENGRATGVSGAVLEPATSERGVATARTTVDTFTIRGRAVVVSSGGIGGNVDLVREMWPTKKLGRAPRKFVVGVPAHVDGRMLKISDDAGANLVNRDRMWHYTEGLTNWDPIWPMHGIRVIPGPSSLWLDATGKRLPSPCFPGCDTRGTLKAILDTGYDHTWFLLDRSIIAKEFALSGSEQNPDITGKSLSLLISNRLFSGGRGTTNVQAFQNKGADFVVRDNLEDLVVGMNELIANEESDSPEHRPPPLEYAAIRKLVEDRDSQVDNPYTKDAQQMLINNGRAYWLDRHTRIAKPHKLLEPGNGPLIAVRMSIVTRKTLGGIQTNLKGQVIGKKDRDQIVPGLYAAGEVAGFGGGGVHGWAALEGTFLGGCIFSGRAVGRTLAAE